MPSSLVQPSYAPSHHPLTTFSSPPCNANLRQQSTLPMAPELLNFSPWRESRLKAAMHANALFVALLAAASVLARHPIAHIFNFPSSNFSLLLAFVLAFASAYVFRVAVKEPVPKTFASIAAVANIVVAVALFVLLLSQALNLTPLTAKLMLAVAATYAGLGVLQILLILHSGNAYHQTELVVV